MINSSRNNEVPGPKQKWCSVLDVSDDKSKVWCFKEQYCIGIWNVRFMNQGKLVVINEMAKVNIDILGISELKLMGMGKFNSDYHYIYYCGQESPLKGNGVTLRVNKSLKYTWVQSQKSQNDLFFLRQTIKNYSIPSLCPKT